EIAQAKSRFAFELKEGPGQGPLIRARDQDYTLPEISAFVLKRTRQIAETALGTPVERAVITVPAHFNELQRASTKVAGRVSGLEVLRILNEPTAAALAYGFGKSGSERIAVYDFGGGTFDLTLLDLSGNVFEVIATAGDSFLGGDDVDNVIADRIAQTIIQQTRFDPRGDVQVMERLRAAAEAVKIALSSQQEMSVELKEIGYGPGGKAIDLKFTMGRTELEQLASALVERTFNVCSEALQLARLKHDAFDNIILVGGSTRIPLVRRKVEAFFAKKPMDRVNPDEVVAIGAAIQAAALTGAERRRQSTPAPILNTDAVKQSRIQTLGGIAKDKAKGPLAPPPPRTTGRLVGPAIPNEPPTLPGNETDEGYSGDEVTVNRAAPFPVGAPPAAPNTRPPPPHRESPSRDQYPSIPGAMNVSPSPSRPGGTAPMVPPSQAHKPLDRTTGRMIAPPGLSTPLPGPPIMHVGPPPLDASPEPQPMPRGFPDLSPEPIALQNLPRGNAQSPMFPPPGVTPPPMPTPLRTPQPSPAPGAGQL
ncbi:MAG: Hsp70 family protein, partial [Polyangiales bacterium]